jgi:molybdate transport system substrate-binding protein
MMKFPCLLTFALTCAVCSHTANTAIAASTNVAVAANFTDAAKEIAALFKTKTGHNAILSFGSSGPLTNQIQQGAPFQIFLSADEERPSLLIKDGLALPESRFTYAIGKIALWSKDPNGVKGADTLKANAFRKLSIADPNAAPYGQAAIEVLKSLQIYDAIKPKIVMGASIAQAFQFIDTSNAEIGFVALSQITGQFGGSRWLVPQELYKEIRQDAVLLKNGAQNEAAKAFMGFLKSAETRAMIEKFGYAIDSELAITNSSISK